LYISKHESAGIREENGSPLKQKKGKPGDRVVLEKTTFLFGESYEGYDEMARIL
jgi:threonine dehydrogenase-like Zn-dependent dehydrogenase